MKKFIQTNFTVIVLVLALLSFFKSCGDSRDISKIKKLLPIHQKSERIDVQQTDLFLERQPLQYFNNQQPQKHKKLKSNKTLLCLLLNHFHQGHNKNKTCTHSDTSSRHNLTSHTVILHKSTTNIHYSRNHTK